MGGKGARGDPPPTGQTGTSQAHLSETDGGARTVLCNGGTLLPCYPTTRRNAPRSFIPPY